MGLSTTFDSSHGAGTDLTPLPNFLRAGLIAVSILAILSFSVSASLTIYLTQKLVTWTLRRRSRATIIARNIPEPPIGAEFTFEEQAFGPQGQSSRDVHEQNVRRLREERDKPPNQFLILIYNLMIADMHQAGAFLLSARWVAADGIIVSRPTCFVQGFFDSNGDLSSSLFITTIAIHTYLSVLKDYRPSQRVLYSILAGIWIFTYSMSLIPMLVTKNGMGHGGYYVRSGPWCWINEDFELLRLLTHYLFIFMALVTTTGLYITIFITLRRQHCQRSASGTSRCAQLRSGHNPAFLIYPVIYVSCTLPLAIGRIAQMAKCDVPMGYLCFAGAMIASNGSFDCLLFGLTRQSIIFGSVDSVGTEDTGLNTFLFMRTPAGKNFGNAIWIQGGTDKGGWSNEVGGWWESLRGRRTNREMGMVRQDYSLSQTSLRGSGKHDMTIHMDVVTSVAVEDGHGPTPRGSGLALDRTRTASQVTSRSSLDKEEDWHGVSQST